MVNTTSEVKAIWQEFHQRLRGFILPRVNNSADADDILQEVFVRIYQRLATLRETERLQSWIFQIARNTIIDYYRKAERQPKFTTEDVLETLAIEEDSVNFNQQIAACLRPLLEQLPASYKEAIELAELEGMTQKAIAKELGVSVSGIKSRVQRGRKKLKQLLQTCCRIEMDAVGNAIEYELKNRQMCRSCGVVE